MAEEDAAVPALGTLLKFRKHKAAAPFDEFVEISECTGMDPPPLKTNFTETTKQKSKFKTKKPTNQEIGDAKFEVNWSKVNESHQFEDGGIMYAWYHKQFLDFRYEDAEGNGEEFSGYIMEISRTYEKEGVQKGDITITFSGEPTLAPA